MVNDDSEHCCGFLDIRLSMYVIPTYTIFHGTFGLLIVATSYYINYDQATNIAAMVSACLFIILGMIMFAVPLTLNEKAAKIIGVITSIVAFCYFVTFGIYFANYFRYYANSLLDRTFFWKFSHCWAGHSSYFTFWHIMTVYLVIFTPFWFYFSYIFYLFGVKLKEHAHDELRPNETFYVYRDPNPRGEPIGYLQPAPTYGRGIVEPLQFRIENPPYANRRR